MSKHLINVAIALLMMATAGGIGNAVQTEGRIASMEAKVENQKVLIKETRDDAREIRDDVKSILRILAERR